ncbi:MAG: RNA polymerase sigma factor [Planctomycetota bacterium]
MGTQTESQLVDAARKGDLGSFGILYQRYYATMVWLAYAILADQGLAEDAAQETFAVACEQIWRLKKPQKFPGWLSAICRNTALQLARERKKEVLIDVVPEQIDERSHSSLAEVVRQAIGALPQQYRELLVLRYYNGMNYEQMGSILGIRKSVVKGRLFRARRKIAKYLKRKGLG